MTQFQITRKDHENLSILYLKGFLDAHTVSIFEEEILKCLGDKRFYLILNLKDLEYISSAGLGVMMGYINNIRSNNGDLKLCEIKPGVKRIINLIGLNKVFEIYQNEQEALTSFQS